MRLDTAQASSKRTGKLIVLFVACDPKTGNSICGKSSGADRVFSENAIQKRSGEFHFVKVCEKGMSEQVRATRALEIVFMDGYGDEYGRTSLSDVKSLDQEMAGVLEKYRPREVSWASTDAKIPADTKKPVVLVFADSTKESTEALKMLRDRSISFFHDRFVFVRSAWKKDSDESKKYAVTQAPSFLVLDRGEVVERVALPKAVWEVKGALTRTLAKVDDRK
jgi:hypothetical protein